MERRCKACASDVEGEGDCVCGESEKSACFVIYIGLSVMDKFPKCGNPMQIPGPHRNLLCDHCLETSTAPDKYWKIISEALESASESPGEPSGWMQNFRTDIDCMVTAPKCPGCKMLLRAAEVPTGTDGGFFCPSCGDDVKTYPAPDWLKIVAREAVEGWKPEQRHRPPSPIPEVDSEVPSVGASPPLPVAAHSRRDRSLWRITCRHDGSTVAHH